MLSVKRNIQQLCTLKVSFVNDLCIAFLQSILLWLLSIRKFINAQRNAVKILIGIARYGEKRISHMVVWIKCGYYTSTQPLYKVYGALLQSNDNVILRSYAFKSGKIMLQSKWNEKKNILLFFCYFIVVVVIVFRVLYSTAEDMATTTRSLRPQFHFNLAF